VLRVGGPYRFAHRPLRGRRWTVYRLHRGPDRDGRRRAHDAAAGAAVQGPAASRCVQRSGRRGDHETGRRGRPPAPRHGQLCPGALADGRVGPGRVRRRDGAAAAWRRRRGPGPHQAGPRGRAAAGGLLDRRQGAAAGPDGSTSAYGGRGQAGAGPTVPGPAAADRADRRRWWTGGRHDLGRLRLADDRDAAAAVPDAAVLGAGRHRPGPGGPASRLGRAGGTCCSGTSGST
jgi:hypothetical protein